MSTKSTIAYSDDFHFYTEAFDTDRVYLELDVANIEATEDGAVLAIPLATWEYIRQFSMADTQDTSETDEQITTKVTALVKARIENYTAARSTGTTGILGLAGSFVYGPVESTSALQIARGIEHFKKVREKKNQLLDTLRCLRELNGR